MRLSQARKRYKVGKSKNELHKFLFLAVLAFIVYFVLDYVDFTAIVGIKINNINMGFFNVFFNSLVVLVLYILTYFVIDKRQVQKDKYARMTAQTLITVSYKNCYDTMKLLANQEIVEKYIVPKVDFNKANLDNRVVTNLRENPFSEYEHILSMAENGYVTNDELKTYLSIKEQYQSYVSNRITFFDIRNAVTEIQIQMKNSIESTEADLFSKLIEKISEHENN